MGVALQVFFNLNVLPEKVEHVEATFLKNLKSKAIESLDGKKINASLLAEETSKHSQVQNKSQLPGRTNRAISAVASAANIAGKHLKKMTTNTTYIENHFANPQYFQNILSF